MKKTLTELQAAPAKVDFDANQWEQIPCAFCHGKGTDPFELLSASSRCEACQGRTTVLVPRPHVRCNFCNGTGSDKTFRCPVCHGAGSVGALPEPTHVCPECEGRGSTFSSELECLKCRGRGRISDAVTTT